jgi:AcrR family transcriptional regulator
LIVARPPSDIATRLVGAARTRFLNEGVDGASLRKIAADAGTNIGMVYYYFKTKDDLFLAVVEEVYSVILADMTQLLTSDLPEDQRLQQLYQRVANMNDEEFQVIRLILREALVSSTRLTRLGTRFLRGHIPVVLRCLSDGIAHGRLRDDLQPVLLLGATFSLGIMPQLVRRLLAGVLPSGAQALPPASDVARVMSDVLLTGIGRQPARPLAASDHKVT